MEWNGMEWDGGKRKKSDKENERVSEGRGENSRRKRGNLT